MNTRLPLLCLLALSLCGCSSVKDKVVVSTSTVLGIELAQNPATQMYQMKLGYARNEIAVIPTNGPQVLTELQFRHVVNRGGLYQRMAVGDLAVQQSALMFSKDASGTLSPEVAAAVTRNISAVPAADPDGTTAKLPLAAAYRTATDKQVFHQAAQTLGYASFDAFLSTPGLTREQVETLRDRLRTAGALP